MAESNAGGDGTGEENTVAKDIVVTKYKMAAEIVNGNRRLNYFVAATLCVTADSFC